VNSLASVAATERRLRNIATDVNIMVAADGSRAVSGALAAQAKVLREKSQSCARFARTCLNPRSADALQAMSAALLERAAVLEGVYAAPILEAQRKD
jgi:hypothetical protein